MKRKNVAVIYSASGGNQCPRALMVSVTAAPDHPEGVRENR